METLYKEISETRREGSMIKKQIVLLQNKLAQLGDILNNREREYYSLKGVCNACKESLCDKTDIYCDNCLNGSDLEE